MESGIWYLPVTDQRKNELKAWLISINEPANELISLNGDASLRRYFIYGDRIAVDSPPSSQKNREFIAINKKLHDAGIYVPQIFAFDLDKGFFLLENLGSTLFADIAKDKGSFEAYEGSDWSRGIIFGHQAAWFSQNARHPEAWKQIFAKLQQFGIRNSQLSAIAPNTSSSLIQGCSASVLPIYSKFLL